MNNCRIGPHKFKFAILQGGIAFGFAFCVPWLLGGDFPLRLRLVFASLGALLFAGFGLIASYLLAYTLEGDVLQNVFPTPGRGRVDLNTAKLSGFPLPVFFLLIDEKTHTTALLPRPFWSNDPRSVANILERVKGVT